MANLDHTCIPEHAYACLNERAAPTPADVEAALISVG
jgi:hypothetical protein